MKTDMSHKISYDKISELIILAVITFLISGCELISTPAITTTPVDTVAIADISAIDGSDLIGIATFTETDEGIHVNIQVQHATPGLHAAHLHTGSGCDDAGPHWHPIGVATGTVGVPVAEATPDKLPIGVGEIGNISVGEDGTGLLEFTTPFWSVGGDPSTDILGKLILIHETGDTFQTNPHQHFSMMQGGAEDGVYHTHIQQTPMGIELTQSTHRCTLAVLGQQIDLEIDHHLPGQVVDPHSHDLLEILLNCFVNPEELVNPAILSSIPLKNSPEYQTFLNLEPKTLVKYHEYFRSIGLPVDPDFFTNQYKTFFPAGIPEEYEQETQKRLTQLYISSGYDYGNVEDAVGFGILLTNFLNERTTAWVLGRFQGDDEAFSEWIVSVLKASQVRPGGGDRIGCGVIVLME